MYHRSFSNSVYSNRSLDVSRCSAMSASAIPKLTSVPPQFDPFRSPQNMMSGHLANTSISAIFKSLKHSDDKDLDPDIEHNSLQSLPSQNNPRHNSFDCNPNRYPASNSNIHGNRNYNDEFLDYVHRRGKTVLREEPARIERTEGFHGYQEVSVEMTDESHAVQTDDSEHVQEGGTLTSQIESDSFNQSLEKETCALFNWIIKPVPGVHAICVEGKKDLSDQTYWHSGIIGRRINEKVVATVTGSVYRLVGNIELLDALSAGFPHKVIEAFWLGFPADWEQIISSYFSNQTLDRAGDAASDDEVTTLDDGAGINEETTGDDTDIVVTDDVDSEEDTHTEDTGDAGTSQSKPAAPVGPVHKSTQVKKTKRSAKEDESVIENWTIKVLPSGKGICILGSKPNGGVWHSSAIEQRLGRRRLQSTTGSIYRLQGNMDKLMALDTGLPEEVVKKFKHGFPKEWLELVQEHLLSGAATKSKKVKTPKENKAYSHTKPASKKPCAKTMSKSEPKISRRALSQPADRGAKHIRSEVKRKRPCIERSTENTILEPQKVVVTPGGQMLDTDTLGRSRSGRLIKPPLQWWAGQRLVGEGDVYRVHAPTLASQQYLSQFEQRYHISRHKVKPFWNPREKDRDYSSNTSRSSANTSASSLCNEATSLDNNGKQRLKLRKPQTHGEEGTSSASRQSCGTSGSSNLMKDTLKILHAGKGKKSATCLGSDVTKGAETEVTVGTEFSNTRIVVYSEGSSESDAEVLRTRRSRSERARKPVKCVNKESEDNSKTTVATQENVISSSTAEPELEEENRTEENVPLVKTSKVIQTARAKRQRSRDGKFKSRSAANSVVDEVEDKNPKKLRRSLRSGKRTLPIIEEMENSLSEDCATVERIPKAAKKRRHTRKGSTDKLAVEEAKPSDHWTKDEKERLHDACQSHNPGHPFYWFKVAEAVRTKSVEECTKMFFQDGLKPRSEKKKPPPKEKGRVTSITANVGTLKRKQQLKELIQQSNENYEDDLFDSTPFKATKKRKVPILGVDDDDDAIYEELARKQGKARFETPKCADVSLTYKIPPAASARKTPVSRVDMDMFDQKRDVDGYVHRIMKRRLINKKKYKQDTPKPIKKVVSEEAIQQKLFHEYLSERKDDKENYEDSDQQEDYYWNDQLETAQA